MTDIKTTTHNESPSIDTIGIEFIENLSKTGWCVTIEDDYKGDFKHFCFKTNNGILKAFTRLDLILMALNHNPKNVEIRFHFFADPNIVGSNKRSFGKKIRENAFAILRSFCENLLKEGNITAKEEETEITPRSQCKIDFGRGTYVTAAYAVELVYWKEP